MRINQNSMAINAYRNLSTNNVMLGKSLEKLSSGFRINRAADDAAGLVISQVAICATTVYLHRGLAHKGLTIHGPAVGLFRVAIWLATGMRPREWVAVHRPKRPMGPWLA